MLMVSDAFNVEEVFADREDEKKKQMKWIKKKSLVRGIEPRSLASNLLTGEYTNHYKLLLRYAPTRASEPRSGLVTSRVDLTTPRSHLRTCHRCEYWGYYLDDEGNY